MSGKLASDRASPARTSLDLGVLERHVACIVPVLSILTTNALRGRNKICVSLGAVIVGQAAVCLGRPVPFALHALATEDEALIGRFDDVDGVSVDDVCHCLRGGGLEELDRVDLLVGCLISRHGKDVVRVWVGSRWSGYGCAG